MQASVASQKEMGAFTQLQKCETADELNSFVGKLKRSGNVFRGKMYYVGKSINEPVSMSQVKQKLAEIADKAPPSEHESICNAASRVNNMARTSIQGLARTLHSIAKIFHGRFGKASASADADISLSIKDLGRRKKAQKSNAELLNKSGFTDYHTLFHNKLSDIDNRLKEINDELKKLDPYEEEATIYQLDDEQRQLETEKKQYDRTDYNANPWASPKYYVDDLKFKEQASANFEKNKVFAYQTTENKVEFAYIDDQGDFKELTSFYKSDIEEGRIDLKEQLEEAMRRTSSGYEDDLEKLMERQEELDTKLAEWGKKDVELKEQSRTLREKIKGEKKEGKSKDQSVDVASIKKKQEALRQEKSTLQASKAQLSADRKAFEEKSLSHLGWMEEFQLDAEVMFKS